MPFLQIFVFPKQEKEDEKSSRLVKQRMMQRFVTELVLLGIYSDLNLVFQLLKDIVTLLSFLFFWTPFVKRGLTIDVAADPIREGPTGRPALGRIIFQEIFGRVDRN